MIVHTPKELLSEIKRIMDINDIQMKDLAVSMHKSQQSVSQIFNNANPKISTLIEICNALDVEIDINFNKR